MIPMLQRSVIYATLRFAQTQNPRHCDVLIHAKRVSVQVELDFYVKLSFAAGLDLDVDFVATGDVWGYNSPLFDVTIFNVPVYLVCFSHR